MNTPQDLNRELVANVDMVVRYLLPEGRRVGREWQVGSVNGEPGQSCSICLEGSKAGVWQDFAAGKPHHGNDLLGLWCEVRKVSFVDALKEAAEFIGVSYEPQRKMQPMKRYTKPERPDKVTGLSDRTVQWFAGRGIGKDVLKTMKIAERDGAIVFPYLSPDGELERLKYRATGAKKIWSSADSVPCLFGWQGIHDNDRFVVICEGEIDQLTYKQAGIPCLSVPFGGGDGNKQEWIEYEFDRLSRFETIFLSFDADEQGEKATAECLKRLAQERCRVVNLPGNDANEVLMQNPNFDFITVLEDARHVDPEELRQLAEFHSETMELFNPSEGTDLGMKMPWSKTFETVRFRPGEVSVWAGINSHGKSVLLSHVVADGVNQGYKFCIASLEMTPARQAEKMYKQIGGTDRPTETYAQEIRNFILDRVWVFNLVGRAKSQRVLDVFLYAKRKYGITHFVIDSLAKCGFKDDDYNAQKEFVDVLMEFARQNEVHIHLVIHMRKTETEHKIGGKFDLRGSGAVADMADNVFLVWRNKPKENVMHGHDDSKKVEYEDKPDALVKCEKQRVTGEEPMIALWFDKQSCQYLQSSGDTLRPYI